MGTGSDDYKETAMNKFMPETQTLNWNGHINGEILVYQN